jgi:hypothetical protein
MDDSSECVACGQRIADHDDAACSGFGREEHWRLEAEAAALRVAELTQDRDEWKQACIDGNTRFKSAEAENAELRAHFSHTLTVVRAAWTFINACEGQQLPAKVFDSFDPLLTALNRLPMGLLAKALDLDNATATPTKDKTHGNQK